MKEIDFLPKWYTSGRRRRVNYRRQYIVIAGVFVTLIAWSFSASLSISVVQAQVEMMHNSLKNNQQIAQGYSDVQSDLKVLEKKKTILERLKTGVNISSTLAEFSYLIGDNITLTELDFKDEILDTGKAKPAGSVKIGIQAAAEETAMPAENIRFKIILKGVARSAADVTAFIKRLEQSDYLCQIIPVILQNIKDTTSAEFEINCYIANYSFK